jgi:hypothetical protein
MIEYDVKVHPNGTVEWRLNGKLHCEHGPAVVHSSGKLEYLRNGKHHRVDCPAIIDSDGGNYWYRYGMCHRDGGPAITNFNGRFWYKEGKLHREDGPAVEHKNGNKFWYLDYQSMSEAEFIKRTTKHIILLDGEEHELPNDVYHDVRKLVKKAQKAQKAVSQEEIDRSFYARN